MNKNTTWILHVAVWLMLFLSPLMFVHEQTFNLAQVTAFCTFPLCMMAVFYTNYLWLVPHYYISHNERFYWTFNFVIIVVLAFFMEWWMYLLHPLFPNHGHPKPEPSFVRHIFFVARNIFNLTVVAFIATTLELSSRWHKMEDERMELEAARKEAELENLRSQINPHFLLNTLNNIYALTAFDTEKAQGAIMELSKLLRHMLYDNQQNTVKLTEELQFIGNYVNLMKLRLPNNVEVHYKVNIPNSYDIEVAPLIFISLVENAFKHGVSPTNKSLIDIAVNATEKKLTYEIINTNYPKTQQDRSGHGIGLQQVERRLKLNYPQKYRWTKGTEDNGRMYVSKIEIDLV